MAEPRVQRRPESIAGPDLENRSELLDLTDFEWSVIAPLLPPERGREGRPAHDNRVVVNGILWRLRTGAPWREMPKRYGKWNSVYRRYDRWSKASKWGAVSILISQILKVREKRGQLEVRRARAAAGTAPPPKRGKSMKGVRARRAKSRRAAPRGAQ